MVNNTSLDAILSAQSFVKPQPTKTTADTGQPATGVLPTAKTRTALELLGTNTAETLADLRLDMRALTTDLFGWSGQPKVTKPLMHKINSMVNDRKNYQQNVELIGFAVAASRMLEPDRIVQLLDAKAKTVFYPA